MNKVKVNFLLPEKLDASSRKLAALTGKSYSAFIRDALVSHCRTQLQEVKNQKELGM